MFNNLNKIYKTTIEEENIEEIQRQKSIIQILESEFTRYLNEKCNKKFKLIYRLLFNIVLILIKFLFLILPKDIFYNLHTNNLIILEKWRK